MSPSFFEHNRQAIAKQTANPIIIFGNDEVHRKADAAFAFAQDANFFYLTGIKEAGWALAIVDNEVTLVAPQRSDSQTLFDGSISYADATKVSGISAIIARNALSEFVEKLLGQNDVVATIGADPHQKYHGFTPNSGPAKGLQLLSERFKSIEDIRPTLAKLRSIKQPEEVAKIKEAIAISIDGFEAVKSKIASFKSENEIAAQLHYDFYRKTPTGHAYDPIVAGGKNACTLHYVDNSQTLSSDELVLIDAGAQLDEYASDITRTYALGTASKRQEQVYQAVKKAHFEIISLIKPGFSLKEYADRSDEIMKQAIQSIGLYKTEDDFRKYFPHAVSHGLGIDVHESLGGYKEFQPGMVLTVEPGIYIPEEGIGVRIEDDILVTDDGNENLTAALSVSL